MKTKILALSLVLVAFATTAFAGNEKPYSEPVSSKKLEIVGRFSKIHVDANLKVVLIPETGNSEIIISGDKSLLDQVDMSIYKGELIVSAGKYVQPGNDLVIFIPVKDLEQVELADGATVSGHYGLKFSKLTVLVNVDSRVDLNISGKLEIKAAPGCDFVYETHKAK